MQYRYQCSCALACAQLNVIVNIYANKFYINSKFIFNVCHKLVMYAYLHIYIGLDKQKWKNGLNFLGSFNYVSR